MDEYFVPSHCYSEENFYAKYLTSDDLTLDGVKQLLGTDFVCADYGNRLHECPLLIALTNKKCSTDIVEHLLQYNSSINCRNQFGQTCVCVALFNSQDDAIVKLLLEKGAKVDNPYCPRLSFFCIATHFHASKSIIKLLLDAKCSCRECVVHGSLMHCALNRQLERLTEDYLDLLLSVGGDLNSLNQDDQSPLCLAIQNGQDAQDIELLLSKGASLSACKMHESPMLCATNCKLIGTPLKADVVQLLIKKKAAMIELIESRSGYTPLQLALLRTHYEVEAIRLMLNHPSVDVNALHENSKDNLLHIAVHNPYCKASIVQLLINKGVRVDQKNNYERIPLDVALMRVDGRKNLKPGIIEVLLRNGSPANGLPEAEVTPLRIAVFNNLDYYILRLLFGAGARFNFSSEHCDISLFKSDFGKKESKNYKMRIERFKLLLKCAYLQNPDFDIQCLRLKRRKHSDFLRYADECRIELQRMELQDLSCDHTLRNFASDHCFLQSSTMTDYDFDQLLGILLKHVFPIYFEVIVAKIGRAFLEEKLRKVHVYTYKNYSSSSCTNICIVLNKESVYGITQYLSDEDLMSLILSYFKH